MVLGAVHSSLNVGAEGGITGLEFVKVEGYTTFRAEYTFEESDIVFHFFLPPELRPHEKSAQVHKYWTEVFPRVLEPVVYDVFKAQPPRLQAAYINDLDINSWWLRAYGFADQLEPAGLCALLFSTLDARLDALKQT